MGTYTPTLEEFTDTARWAGADEATISAARHCREPRLVISGRLASGKDTVAEAAMQAIGRPDAVRVSFATALRREVDEIIDAVRRNDPFDAVAVVAETGGITKKQAECIAELICGALALDFSVTSRNRTREIRTLLQKWGTDIRRAADSGYWVKQAMLQVVELLAEGRAVYVTDARFINEVEPARRLGFLAVRLEVDLPIRGARLYARDGLAIDPAAENHPSEKELEGHQGFDLWVDNSGFLEDSVRDVTDALATRFPRVAASI